MGNAAALMRLLHLVSPSLPTGAFAYSQGLEWGIDAGWITDGSDLQAWLDDLMHHAMVFVDIPVLKRMMVACRSRSETELAVWCSYLLSCRETGELRKEEMDRGKAMVQLLSGLEIPFAREWRQTLSRSQLAGFALASAAWQIPIEDAAAGYVWSWLENQVLAGMKTIPLGQTQGHGILYSLAGKIPDVVSQGLDISEEDMGASSPALAMASSLHETQYTRIYRS